MGLSRRSLFKGLAGAAAGALVLPKTVEANAEEVRRYWSLDRTMTGRHNISTWTVDIAEDDPIRGYFEDFKPYGQATYEWGQSYSPQVSTGPVYATFEHPIVLGPARERDESLVEQWLEATEPKDTHLAWVRSLKPEDWLGAGDE